MRAVVGVPLVLAAVLLAAASVVPLRFDLRTFQVQARLEPLGLPRASDFLVLTRDNSIAAAELAQFALAHWSFPHGVRYWLTLAETRDGAWNGGFLAVDERGTFLRPVARNHGWSFEAAPRPSWLPVVVARAAVVYDTQATRDAFEQRVPELLAAKRVFVAGTERPAQVPLTRPHLLLSPLRLLRLAAVLGTLVSALMLLRRAVGNHAPASVRILATAVGVNAGWAVLIAAVYVAGELQPGLGRAVPFGLWLAGGAVAWRLAPAERTSPVHDEPAWRAALAAAIVLYAAVVVLRLDFDGDTYTTYIPVARYMHLLGHHDPRDPGVVSLVQGAVYPPGFPTLLALPLWVMDQPGEASFALGPETSAAVLLYRTLVVTLDVAFLAALAAFLAGPARGTPHLALAGVLGALALAPMLRGAHTAAETLLVPLLGTALVALAAGRRARQPVLAATGLFLGGFLTLVKLDGLPALVLLVLPVWLAAAEPGLALASPWRRARPLVGALALGLLPFVVWRCTGPATNPAFADTRLAHAVAQLPTLGVEAFKLLVRHDLWLPLFVLLPAAVVSRARRGARWRDWLVPLGVAAQCGAWVAVYAFSTLAVHDHMATSLPRIAVAPALAALLYALESCALPSPWPGDVA